MRSDEQFPAGFGFDPGMSVGIAASMAMRAEPGMLPEQTPATGPLAAPYELSPAQYGAATVELGRRGFHLDAAVEETEAEPEPQSVVITTALFGILLASASFFVDLG